MEGSAVTDTVLKIVVVVPTYNERENVGLLIDALEQQFQRLRHDMHILVVDDNSPDDTAAVVREKAAVVDNLHLLSSNRIGLGDAYVRGLSFALEVLKADAVVQMDADFSHRPEDLPYLLEAFDEGRDVVIGSRYTVGGSVPANWAFFRKALSSLGNLVARYLAGLYRVRDCTAGFRVLRSELLRKIDLQAIRVQGYAFQVTLLHEAFVEDADILEKPVDFVDRVRGESKLGFRDIVEFVVNAWWIRLRNSRTFIRFGIVGLSGTVVNVGLFSLLLSAGMDKFLASPLAIEVSIVWNFLLNNYWTFGHRKTRDRKRIKGLKYNFVSLVALAVSYTTFVILAVSFPHVRPELHQIAGIVPATLVNYFLNSYWTFAEDPVASQ
jgi:dolichol-phosphate mannosyltransferase